MPYVVCARCRLRTYSAALWISTEECPSCGAELPRADRKVIPIAAHPRFAASPPEPTTAREDGSREAGHE